MNVYAPVTRVEALKLKVEDYLRLRHADSFVAFHKAELIDGELFGVFKAAVPEHQDDRIYPIKLTVRDYRMLADADAFGDTKTELIDGAVYPMSPQYRRHGFVKDELTYRLRRKLEEIGSSWRVATEQSVEISRVSEPQPDIILTDEPHGDGPIPLRSIGLVCEVAAASLRYDKTEKLRIYAAASIPEYWIVDVSDRRIRVYWAPQGDSYAREREVPFEALLVAVNIAGLEIATTGL